MILIPVEEMEFDSKSLVWWWLLGHKFCVEHVLSLPGWRGAFGVMV